MKRTAIALTGAAVVIGGGTLVMSQALAAPASQSQRIDGPEVSNSQSPAGAVTEDRITPASTRAPSAANHDADDDRVNPGAHDADDDRVNPGAHDADDDRVNPGAHDANEDRATPGATHVEPGDDHGRRHGGHGADDGTGHEAGDDHGGNSGH
jgi:hypothetical protein